MAECQVATVSLRGSVIIVPKTIVGFVARVIDLGAVMVLKLDTTPNCPPLRNIPLQAGDLQRIVDSEGLRGPTDLVGRLVRYEVEEMRLELWDGTG